MADRKRLDRDFLDEPPLSEVAGQDRKIDLAKALCGVGAVEPVGAFVDLLRSDETAAGEERRGDAADAGPARMHALVPRAVRAMLGNRRGRAPREALGHGK